MGRKALILYGNLLGGHFGPPLWVSQVHLVRSVPTEWFRDSIERCEVMVLCFFFAFWIMSYVQDKKKKDINFLRTDTVQP